MIICITGLPGSGKSAVANLIKENLENRGIKVCHHTTDEMRYRLYPELLGNKTEMGRDFTPEELSRSYNALFMVLEETLKANPESILVTDGTFRKESQRAQLMEIAKKYNTEGFIVKVSAQDQTVLSRLQERFIKGEGSDSSYYLELKKTYEEPAGENVVCIRNDGCLEELKNQTDDFLNDIFSVGAKRRSETAKTVSIVIRTKNEERWIGKCLSSVFSQDFKDFEVILVDSGSQDRTVEKAKNFNVKLVDYSGEFKPGKAINEGIRASSGKYIVLLSGHCVPVNNQWLGNLIKEIESPEVAGVYGRQEPLPFSTDLDKRDLLIIFGLDKKVQTKDSFFYNANCIIKRSLWREIPFDEEISHIEDRIWAKEALKKGYKIVYTPEASCYHYHGIYQNADPKRAKEIVEIIEKIGEGGKAESIDVGKLKVAGIIPAKGEVEYLGQRPLIEYSILRAFQSKYLNLVAVTTDNPQIADIARSLGVKLIFIYPPELMDERVEIREVLNFAITQFEKMEIIPDIITYISPTYPFRPKGLIDEVIDKLTNGGYDSVLPVLPEYRVAWAEEDGKKKRIDKGIMPSKFKEPIYTGLSGLATASFADVIKKGQDRLGERVGMVEIDNLLYYIDIGKAKAKEMAEILIKDWWQNNK